jgi:hypothetical protein
LVKAAHRAHPPGVQGQTSNIRKLCEIQVLFWRLYITVSNTTPRFMTKSRSTLYLFTHTW